MVWNLEGMMKGAHISLHHTNLHKDTSNRRCFDCGSDKTSMKKPRTHRTPYPNWVHIPSDQNNWYCFNCYRNNWRKINNRH